MPPSSRDVLDSSDSVDHKVLDKFEFALLAELAAHDVGVDGAR